MEGRSAAWHKPQQVSDAMRELERRRVEVQQLRRVVQDVVRERGEAEDACLASAQVSDRLRGKLAAGEQTLAAARDATERERAAVAAVILEIGHAH